MIKKIYRKISPKYAYYLKEINYFFIRIYYDFLNIRRYGTKDMFNDINIETTTYCNRRCFYCPNSVFERSLKKNEKLMPESVFRKIINELAEINFKGRISPHFYGEPLLDKRLVDLMEYAHEKLPKAKLEIYTNGDLLKIDILDKLYKVGVRHYVITLHGNEDEKNKNQKRIDELMNYIKKTGKNINIDLLIFKKDTPLSTRTGLVRVEKIMKVPSCAYPTNPLVINYKGDVVLCCNDYFGEIIFGNLQKDNIMDVWHKSNFEKIRKQLKSRLYNLAICKKCVK